MKTVAIIQARMGSTRLPAKVLADIAGKPMLQRVVERAQHFKNVDEVVVATSRLTADDAIAALASALGVRVTRGSEDDVLDRYVEAARATDADVIVRITADCPLVDPVVGALIVHELESHPTLDYASNTIKRTFPRGLDVEAIRRAALERAHAEATDVPSREHVTYYVYRHPDMFQIAHVTASDDHSDLRWTVVTEDDLTLVRAIYAELGERAGYPDVIELFKARPELAKINAHVEQKRT